MGKVSIVWMRRNLRIEDNKVIHEALRNSESILPIFIFDTTILKRFSRKDDRRLSFIANILYGINTELQAFNGELTVFHGNPVQIVPKLAKLLNVSTVYADEDFEPENIQRDEKVKKGLKKDQDLELHVDHLIVRPDVIVKNDGTAFKKFTPYMKVYREYIDDNADELMTKFTYQLKGKIVTDIDFSKADLNVIKLNHSPKNILDQIGYEYREDNLWHPNKAKKALSNFIDSKIKDYKVNRDFMATNGTSRLSPYLRFGVVSIRECLNEAYPFRKTAGGDQWLNELIWREFYVSIIFHFPEAATDEFQAKYRNRLTWSDNKAGLRKFTEGRTGFPIVDAAVRQLLEDGWVHNRSRMILASFLTKNLFIDWREGEEFFAQHLMDYDLSSNTGGWQWGSSVGVDSMPYFRVFNPYSQSEKFDPDAEYIKKYVPELQKVSAALIHSPNLHKHVPDYPKPIVDYKTSREQAISYFRNLG